MRLRCLQDAPCSLNVHGTLGAFRALEGLVPDFHVVGLQETRFSDSDKSSFSRAAEARGFKTQPDARGDGTPGAGGVVLLVHQTVAHRFADKVAVGNAEVLMIWSQGLAILTYYGPP